jgi:hypothetical protein
MPLKITDRANRLHRAGADRRAGREGEEGLETDFHREGYHESYPMSNNTL